jgi:hypothetical protein
MSIHNSLRVAVEDRFTVLRLREDKAVLPDGVILENLADTLTNLSKEYDILCDWRGLRHITNDVTELIYFLARNQNTKIIARPEEAALIRDCLPGIPPFSK